MELSDLTIKALRLLALGDAEDDSDDKLLTLLYGYADARFRLVLDRARRIYGLPKPNTDPEDPDDPEIPEALSWILEEVTVKRYRRIGSEGMQAESVEGHSMTFDRHDFADYASVIDDYFNPGDLSGVRPGKVVVY